MEFFFIMKVRMMVRVSLGWFFKEKHFKKKKIAPLLNEESSSHFEVFWKTTTSKIFKKPLMESSFSNWQLEAFNYIKLKNKLLGS